MNFSLSERQGHDLVVMVGGVMRSRRNILAGAAVEDLELDDGTNGCLHIPQVGIVVLLDEAHELARLESGELLEHIIRLTGHIVSGIHHEQIAGFGFIIAILAGLLIGFIDQHPEISRAGGVVAAVRAESGAEVAGALLCPEVLSYHRIGCQQLGLFRQRRSKDNGQHRHPQQKDFLKHRHIVVSDTDKAPRVEEFIYNNKENFTEIGRKECFTSNNQSQQAAP